MWPSFKVASEAIVLQDDNHGYQMADINLTIVLLIGNFLLERKIYFIQIV